MAASASGQLDKTTPGDTCPLCEGTTRTFLTRRGVPVHQNLLVRTAEEARGVRRGDLELAVCPQCGFVRNQTFDAALLEYGEQYENTQMCSDSFQRHVDSLVEYLIHQAGVQHCRIVEIGCGKGQFLRKLIEPEEAGNVGVGFDPSYTGPDSEFQGRLTFQRRFYDETCLDTPADVILCRHVIEHTPNPLGLLRMIRRRLETSHRPRVFLETPCVEWILRNQVIWDLFYEHCSLFTADSLTFALSKAQLRPVRTMHVFGGQYLWIEAEGFTDTPEPVDGRGAAELATAFSAAEKNIVADWKRRVERWAAEGPLALWGAGAKGCTLANLCDAEQIDSVIDINPAKQGHYIPGTGHPIVGADQIAPRHIDRIVLMNPNYREEITALLARAERNIPLME